MELTDRDWHFHAQWMPQALELNLPTEVLGVLQKKATQSGRSIEEIILEILDRGLPTDCPDIS